jgi:1,2-diacylglycerol 3-alpha-glucosyltransferase
MNIGIITQWYPSGAGNVSKAYFNSLRIEHDVFIYSRGGPNLFDNEEWNQDFVTFAPNHSQLTGINKQHFTKWITTNQITAVIFNEQRQWEGVLLAKKMNLLTGAYIDYYKQDTVVLFDSYDFLLCNTQRHFEVFKSHKQSIYIPWGTNVMAFTKKPNVKSKIRFLVLSNRGLGFLENAPWLDRSNTEVAVRAFIRIIGDCELIIFSQIDLIETPKYFQELVNSDSRIKFKVETYDNFPYESGDIYVYPSRLDGIGLTLLEAMSFGLPCITTDYQPMNEFVIDGYNGKLIKVARLKGRPDGYYWPESIVCIDSLHTIMQFYVDNPRYILEHGDNAINYVKEARDWKKNSSELPSLVSKFVKYDIESDLEQKMLHQDLKDNPSSLQRISIAVKSLIKSVIY